MEKGLPNRAQLFIRRKSVVVYDLVAGTVVAAAEVKDGTEWETVLGPGAGCLYMISPTPVAGVTVAVAPRDPGDREAHIRVGIVDAEGNPLSAVLPVQVTILDPGGREAEFSGHYGVADGRTDIQLNLPVNDEPGTWTITATEGATGTHATGSFEYR